MVTRVVLATPVVATLKVALELPAATVTLAGTVAAVLLLASETVTPPVGEIPFKVTVPVEETPPRTAVGFRVTELTCTAGIMPSIAVWVAPLNIAVIVAVVDAATALVVTVKVADVLL
jgi:hypothetical protein